jgi:virginiamycin B lyase
MKASMVLALELCASLALVSCAGADRRAVPLSFERFGTAAVSRHATTPQIGQITEFPLPKGSTGPFIIAQGPDGALWFTEIYSTQIGRITTSGGITEFNVSNLRPWGIASGPDGALWFTYEDGAVGRISTDGQLTEYRVPGSLHLLYSITAGSDGALWFSMGTGIGRITVSGQITQFPQAPSYLGITSGPDGALWYGAGGGVGRLTTAGSVTLYPIHGQNVQYVATGPDHKIWFTQHLACNVAFVGNITTTGQIVQYHPLRCSEPTGIAAGPDGAMWFTELNYDHIDRITLNGQITRYKIPTGGAGAYGITAGPDGAMWFTERGAHKIGRIQAI